MIDHRIGTHEEWLAARLSLLEDEKEHTRRGDALARRRQELPWVPVDKDYTFGTEDGPATLADLFRGNSQLLVYHFMFGPDYTAGCPSCSSIADGFNGSVVHLANHDVTLHAVSQAPLEKLLSYRRRMGWTFPWASSAGSDFNYDFRVTHSVQEWRPGSVEYNYRRMDASDVDRPDVLQMANGVGVDWPTYRQQGPGLSAFVLDGGTVYHTYSSYERGVDGIWGMYAWLDRAPLGRNETGVWWRRKDEYDAQPGLAS